ncbi:hypothetical protein ACTD5D_15965 [Nocardia takedensis]|uniref:hypothetical protein n=1 Tax=Nocardia takedensis TaxID=259390 RepID=UPI00030B83F9|nr:hypothetical protein [Nocardia takedensis]
MVLLSRGEGMSWRETTSESAQADIDDLLDVALDMAARRLADGGEFFPFAVVVERDGTKQVIVSEAETAARAHERNGEVIESMRMRIKAAALVVDVRIPATGSEGIEVYLEHAEGPAMTVVQPYRREQGTVLVDELAGFAAERRVWR